MLLLLLLLLLPNGIYAYGDENGIEAGGWLKAALVLLLVPIAEVAKQLFFLEVFKLYERRRTGGKSNREP